LRLIHADFYARYRPLANPFNPITAQLPRTIEGRLNATSQSGADVSDHTLSKISNIPSNTTGRVSIHSLDNTNTNTNGSSSLQHCTDPKILCDNLLIALWDESVPEMELETDTTSTNTTTDNVAVGAVGTLYTTPPPKSKSKPKMRRASRISEMALWKGKGETAKESIQLGLTKVFLRKQAHDLLETRRSRRLVSAARKIQSNYRRHIVQKMYANIRRAIRKLQGVMRMLYSRRYAHHLRCNRAILIIQKYYRCYNCFIKFQDYMWSIVRLQNCYRRIVARKSYIVMRYVYIYIYVDVCDGVYIYACVCMYMCVCVCVDECVYVCMSVYISVMRVMSVCYECVFVYFDILF